MTFTQPPTFNPNETYALTATNAIVRGSDKAVIPADPNNSDYRAFLAWQASGKTPTPYTPPPAPPTTLTFLQFMGLFTTAEQEAIVSSTDTQTKLFLLMASGAGTIQLDNPEVIAGVGYLAATSTSTPPGPGLIAPARVARILSNTPHS